MKFVISLVEETGCVIVLLVSASSSDEAKEKALAYYKDKVIEPKNVKVNKVIDASSDDTVILTVF